MLTLEGLLLVVRVILDACISILTNVIVLVLKTPWTVLNKGSTPVACLMQLEGILMSMLGYIVKAIMVSQTRPSLAPHIVTYNYETAVLIIAASYTE